MKKVYIYECGEIVPVNLSAATQKKISQYRKRCKELANIVKKPILIKSSVSVIWDDLHPSAVEEREIDDIYAVIEKEREKFEKEIKKEAKKIGNFADKLAKKLRIDKDQFWLENFAA